MKTREEELTAMYRAAVRVLTDWIRIDPFLRTCYLDRSVQMRDQFGMRSSWHIIDGGAGKP